MLHLAREEHLFSFVGFELEVISKAWMRDAAFVLVFHGDEGGVEEDDSFVEEEVQAGPEFVATGVFRGLTELKR